MKKNIKNSPDTIVFEIEKIYRGLREKKFKEWNRVLPLNELLVDRWEKAKFVKAKSGTSIYDSCFIFGNVSIGNSTWIGPFTILDGSGGKLSIGNFCSISSGVQIYTHSSVDWALTGGKTKYEKKPVKIGSCCYVGPNALVAMGSEIGSHSIIGANCLVNGKIPPYSIVFGTPGRIVGKIKILKNKPIIQYFDKPKNIKKT